MSAATPPRSEPAALARRERNAILASLMGVTMLCWIALVDMAVEMSMTGDMGGMMSAMLEPKPWRVIDFWMMFWMWVVMMIGMMLPSATPMVLVYAGIVRKAAREGTIVAPTFFFVAGYIAIWTLFSAAATAAQWGLDQTRLLSPMMVTTSPLLGGGLLIAAGIYQLTPYKQACLEHCRAPAHFISRSWRPGKTGALRMGLAHGAWCLGCCWLLMGLLFFGGVMDLVWIGGITIFVLLEKILPIGPWGARVSGLALMVLGGGVIAAG